MKRKIFYIIGGALLFSGGVLAGKIPAVKKNTDIAHHDHLHSKQVTPADLYLRAPGGACTRATVCSACIAGIFQLGVAAGQSKAVSTSGTQYTLWDNPNCNTANGGQQIALFP